MNPELWARIKPIFYEAAEQPASERAAFIRSRCGDDESLAIEIESLLDAHDHAGAFIEGVPEDSASMGLGVEPPDGLVGRRIGSYELSREIARGGMGAVYLAERADGEYQKKVAIKLVRRGIDTEFIIRRFRSERQILAGLDHPNIARLLDGGATENGLPYFVMEYIDGMPIDLHCDTNGLSIRERLKLFRTVCSAVHYAHQRSIIHRDIKPRNIMVTADGTPKLLDFGIAKLFDPELSSQAIGSTTTSLMMTPEYASPEQIRGEPVTTASDLYSLGVLLYELLTGHRPYRLRNRQPHEIARVICEEEPQKPSTAVSRTEDVPGTDGKTMVTLTPESVSRTRDGEVGVLRRLLSGDVDSIVLMAMRKQPEQRYSSVDELSNDIGRHLDGLPVLARKHMRWRLRGSLRAHWKAAAALLLLLALLLIAPRLLTRSADSGAQTGLPGIRTVAVLPLRSLDPNEDQSLGLKLTDALIQRLGRLRQIVVRPTGSVQGYESRRLDPFEAGREQQVDAVIDGSFQRSGQRLRVRVQLLRVSDGRQLWEQAFDQGSNDPFYLQDALAEQAAQALLPRLAGEDRKLVVRRDTENVEANRLYSEGRYYWNKRNVEGLRKSVELIEQAVALDSRYARAYSALADSYITLSDYALLPAVEAYPKARDAATKALALDDSLGEAYTALAMIKAGHDWDWAGADHAFQQAIQRNPHYATAHQWYAEFLTGMGRHQEALEQIHLAQQLDPLSLIIKSIEALNLNYARDYEGAIAQCLRVTSMDPSFGEVYAYLGFAYEQKGMFREAMDAYQKYSTLMGYNTPAKAAIRSSPVLDARDYWKKMFELSKPPAGSKLGAAQALAQLGETDQAIAFLEQACAGHSYGVLYLNVHPSLDRLRTDPRFQELMRRVALAN